ncbi:hypothetical protein AB0H00_29585 [Nocardia sp. NPDC023852]|uniref:hypothetical protein n=1 Tax=Nocardia sp. NPDC023852 TaxID=3154697 RepID=UPI0033FC42BA
MVSDATAHHADYVGQDRWVVDYLPGRQLTREQARAAMRIAVAPDRFEVDAWAATLGMTAAEVARCEQSVLPVNGSAVAR